MVIGRRNERAPADVSKSNTKRNEKEDRNDIVMHSNRRDRFKTFTKNGLGFVFGRFFIMCGNSVLVNLYWFTVDRNEGRGFMEVKRKVGRPKMDKPREKHMVRSHANEWELIDRFAYLVKYVNLEECKKALEELEKILLKDKL